MSLAPQDPLNPHFYTSGRWLFRDKLQRDSRYIQFDFDALCKRVVELTPGAFFVASYEKKEGGFNRVFVFTTDNGRRVVARLPNAIAGPPRLTTNSEVATITYLQSNTTIPIPTILDWSDDASNTIGSEYIIMEPAAGIQLHQKWPTMSGKQQITCIHAISLNTKQMAKIEFPAYGSLYFADIKMDSAYKEPWIQGFCIGPHCGTKYWDCNVGEARYYDSTRPNRGPWSDLTAYCDGLIDAGLSRVPPVDTVADKRPPYHGSVADHIRLLNFGRDVIHKLLEDTRIRNTAVPTLLHADLHKRNIFVSEDDPTVVTSIIDWQSSSVEPAFMYADEVPDFAVPVYHPSSECQPVEVNAELCLQAFDACLKGLVPRLCAARALDDRLTRPFRYCHRTWRDGAVAFRQELIEISRHWKELGLAEPCPYPTPTTEELLTHENEFEGFETAQKLKRNLMYLLDTPADGWVPVDLWEATKIAHREAFNEINQAVRDAKSTDDQSMSEEELRMIWPFDI